MCIRYSTEGDLIRWSRDLQIWIPVGDWTTGVDTYPGYAAPIIVPDLAPGRTERMALTLAMWGLQPAWAKEPDYGRKHAYNARAETLAEKPTFRRAYRHSRCAIPLSAFYEQSERRWIRFSGAEREYLLVAGLMENPGPVLADRTFAMVTTPPNGIVSPYQDRMPALLDPADLPQWLDPSTPEAALRALLLPSPESWMKAEDVGPVGRAGRPPKPSLFDEAALEP